MSDLDLTLSIILTLAACAYVVIMILRAED
jgi:hypothetical protein